MVRIAIYWGVWLILPVLVDGLTSLVQMAQVLVQHLRRSPHPPAPSPKGGEGGKEKSGRYRGGKGVSVIIPVYNGEESLGRCLESLRKQNFPQELLEIIVVNNGSTDNTQKVFTHHAARSFGGQMHWISITGRGKSYALNAGLHLASHGYICNVDCDTRLHPDAIRNMVEYFESDREVGAATGSIEVLPATDSVAQKDRTAFLIAECEFQEYLSAFWLGRQGETLSNSLFTLAGAFSFFRREVLLSTLLYDKQTVSEDTKMTLDIRKKFQEKRIGCLPEAIAYVTPTPSLAALYSQRVRWQRGEIEVAAMHESLMTQNWLQLRGLALGRMMLIDHTFLFPRLVWSFLFPALVFFGYPPGLILSALLIIYIFYIFIAGISAAVVYALADANIRSRLRKQWWIISVIPIYRMLIFVFRLAGSIITLTEPPGWRVQPPWVEIRVAAQEMRKEARQYWKKLTTRRGTSNGV